MGRTQLTAASPLAACAAAQPENILFTKNMVLKLGDFGLAIDLREERAVTRAGTLVSLVMMTGCAQQHPRIAPPHSTPALHRPLLFPAHTPLPAGAARAARASSQDYMAPEVLRCPFKSRPEENKDNAGLHYGARVDAWAVGVLTFELLAGFPPFFDQSRTNTEQHIVTKTPEFPPTVSDEAVDFIRRALLKNPADRPTIQEMLNHQWIEQYRARRSMRSVPTSSVDAQPHHQQAQHQQAQQQHLQHQHQQQHVAAAAMPVAAAAAGTLAAGHASAHSARAAAAAAAAAALAAPPTLPQHLQHLQQHPQLHLPASKTRLVATQTNITAGTMVQQAMVAQQQMAMAAAANKALPCYPAPLAHIMNSINEDPGVPPVTSGVPPPAAAAAAGFLAHPHLAAHHHQQQQQAALLAAGAKLSSSAAAMAAQLQMNQAAQSNAMGALAAALRAASGDASVYMNVAPAPWQQQQQQQYAAMSKAPAPAVDKQVLAQYLATGVLPAPPGPQ